MNGVRRLLGGGTQRPQSPPAQGRTSTEIPPVPPLQTIAPLSFSSKPSWPPFPLTPTSNGTPTRPDSASSTTMSMSLAANGNQRAASSRGNSLDNDSRPHPSSLGSHSSHGRVLIPSGSSPRLNMNVIAGPSRPLPDRVAELAKKPVNLFGRGRGSEPIDTRDELLMSLLTSEAMLDSKEFTILNAEEVEELKREYKILNSRLSAIQNKLKVEIKIRDAAASLLKVNTIQKEASKQSTEQLNNANKRVESVQTEHWRTSERSNEIYRKLLEHQAGVLSFSLRNIETSIAGDTDESGYNTPVRSSQMSPTASEMSHTSSSRAKFEGPHFYAGHENAVQPQSPRKPPTIAEYALLEERLQEANLKLHAAAEAQNDARREAVHLKLVKEELETSLGLELQIAEERVTSMREELTKLNTLEVQLKSLSDEKEEWLAERETNRKEIDYLGRRLGEVESKNKGLTGVESRFQEYSSVLASLRTVLERHNVEILDDSSASGYVLSVEKHLTNSQPLLDVQRQKDEWESDRHKLETDLAESKRQIYALEMRLKDQSISPIDSSKSYPLVNGDVPQDIAKIIQTLQPVWNALPSPEARASKFGQRTKSPVSVPGSPNTSLSELDVRLLKTLYDGRPAYQAINNTTGFTIEAFIARVQALIADDRALIERLIRFAQAHDLLKKNAERAQKLAQESSVALETYQKQVKVLEDRNMSLVAKVTTLQDEIHELQESVDKVFAEKRDVEMRAAEQAETCRQLSEANNSLSAKTLSLAQEAVSAPEAVRSQLEKQLADCKEELEKTKEDLNAIKSAEVSQNIALMDELNSLQGENDTLRAQLRTLQAGAKK